MSIVLVVTFRPKDGCKQQLISAMNAGILAVHAEPGCELYSIHDAEDGTVTMIEKWRSEAELQAHANGEAVATLNADIESFIAAAPVVTHMIPIPVGNAPVGIL